MSDNPRIEMIERFHLILLEETVTEPMKGAECTLIAAYMLGALAGTDESAFLEAARLAWHEGVTLRRTRIRGPLGNGNLVTVALDPDETRLRISERILTLAHAERAGVPPIVAAALCLQLAAGWAGTSYAMTEKRFLQSARRAYERSGHWFEFHEPETR